MLAVLFVLGGCASTDTVPAWAMDPLWIEPVGDSDVHGFQTWELFSTKWAKKYDEKHYLCSIVVEFDGVPDPGEACRDCDHAWAVTTSLLETDCGGDVAEDPGFLSLSRVGLGPVPSDLGSDDPYPGESQGAYADYSVGEWTSHGWAYPESLDNRGLADDLAWNGEQPFTAWPAYVWELGG